MVSYPEINVKVAGATKLSVADLERDRHLVIDMKILVEAFSAVRRQLDDVSRYRAQQATCEQQSSRSDEIHGYGGRWENCR
jgi:hypothetical protein